jgi:hypothetical protein
MENCSNANNEPRTSGGLISAIYKGQSMLRSFRMPRRQACQPFWTGKSRGQVRLYLSAPTPRPPMALPPVICVKDCAHVCKAEPMQKTASRDHQSQKPQHRQRASSFAWEPHAPHADAIAVRLDTRSASTPAPSAPNRHPNSSTAAIVFVFRASPQPRPRPRPPSAPSSN